MCGIVGYYVREAMHGNGVLNYKIALNNMLNKKQIKDKLYLKL